jgi:uncharacterized protein
VIVSPAVLDDGTPFPTLAWLTCPYLTEALSVEESAGGAAAWAERASTDPDIAGSLRASDAALRAMRAAESGGADPCAAVGLGGQRDPLGVKCLHAHAALALLGIADPVGVAELGKIPDRCSDERCATLTSTAPPSLGGD